MSAQTPPRSHQMLPFSGKSGSSVHRRNDSRSVTDDGIVRRKSSTIIVVIGWSPNRQANPQKSVSFYVQELAGIQKRVAQLHERLMFGLLSCRLGRAKCRGLTFEQPRANLHFRLSWQARQRYSIRQSDRLSAFAPANRLTRAANSTAARPRIRRCCIANACNGTDDESRRVAIIRN